MAEGLLGGVLGGDDEKREAEASEARAGVETTAGAEAFAAAIAARLSGNDPGVARKTEIFLEKQAQLLETQRQHLEDEHALRLEHLAHQRHLLRGQRVGQAIRIAFQVLIALLVLAIGLGIAAMLHSAFTSHEVVIDAFDAPAGLAGRGVTGRVVAGDVLDELTRLQNATSGTAATFKRSLSNVWSNQLRVEVPDTGISLGELSGLLRAHFGHDLHIGGALVETDTGQLALTVRGDNLAPKTFTGGAGTLQPLAAEAAQYVYAQSEPALWAFYLGRHGRCPEAIAFIRAAYAGADPQYRPYLINQEANCTRGADRATEREQLALYHEAQVLNPDYWVTYLNEQQTLAGSGDEEGAWRAAQALRQAAGGQPGAAPRIYFMEWDELTGDFQAEREAWIDYLKAGERSEPVPRAVVLMWVAFVDLALHDPDAAELALQNAPQTTPIADHTAALIRARVAEERGDPATAAQEVEAAFAGVANPFGRDPRATDAQEPGSGCIIAPIQEAAGHPENADAILANPAAAHFLDCQRFRGDILDHRGDWVGAQRAYAQAVALAPDLPAGYYSWGVALARHGNLAGAIAKLQAANQRGPHWADPLKAWGDVLAKQGYSSDALEKYDEALRYAPNWAALRQARAAAASRRD